MIIAGVLPIPIVCLLRRFQILKADLDIHQGSIRRNETTTSTKHMMDDDDVRDALDLKVFEMNDSNRIAVVSLTIRC